MAQLYPNNKLNKIAQNQPSFSQNSSTTPLRSQFDAYPNASNAQKLETLKHLFKAIDTQAARINQLEMAGRRAQTQSEHTQSQRTIAAKLDQINQRREQTTIKLIEDLKSQNQQLRNKISSLQSQKRNVKTQVKMPSFLEKFNTELKSKLGHEAEIIKLKLFNSTLQGEKDKLLQQLNNVRQQTDKFCKNFRKDYQDLNTKYAALVNGKVDLEKEFYRLKQGERKAQDDLKKARKQMEQNHSGSQLYFKYIVEILKQVTILEGPEKWTNFLNLLKQEDFSQENKRAKIKQTIRENSRKLAEVKARLQKAEDVKAELQRQSNNQQTILSQRVNELQLANKRKTQIQAKLSKQAALNSSLSQQKEKLTQIKNKQQQDIRDLTEATKRLKLSVDSLEKEKAKDNLTISSQQSQIAKLQESKLVQEKTIQKLNGEIKAHISKMTSLEATVNRLNIQIEGLKNGIHQLKGQMQNKNKTIKELNAKMVEKQRTVDGQSAEIRRQIDEIGRQKDNNKVLKGKNSKLQKDVTILEQKNKAYEREIQRSSAQLTSNKYRIDGLETILSKVNSNLIGQASHYYLGQGLNIKALTFQKLKDLDGEILTLLSKWKDSYNRAKFFNGSDIITRDNVGFIVESLDEYMGCLPYESKLVYKYDPLNLVNFHNYFDKVQNLITFIRLTNGTVIGGFTVYPVDPDRIMRPGKGFLFSVTSKKVYHIRSEPKLPVVSYDNYYFIFGNAEIRLKSQEKKVFSNFGIANSTFDNGTIPRTTFLNVAEVTNNELDIDTYEFYRMSFKA